MSNEIEMITAPPVESPAPESAPQETPAPAQAVPEPQDTGARPVETGDNKPQAPEITQRKKPSDYYRERERFRSLQETVTAQSQQLQEMAELIRGLKKPEVADDGKFDPNAFWTDPDKVLSAREAKLLKEINGLKGEIQTWKESQTQAERTKREQEALELLFPKPSPDSPVSLKDRIAQDPDRAERILELLKSTGLDEFSKINPTVAANLALKLLDDKPAQASPTVIKKSLMGNTARGTPGVGGTRPNPKDDKRSELKRMQEDMSANPELRFDPKHKERRDQLIRDLERLEKE